MSRIVLLVFFSFFFLAAQAARISGRITDASGHPLAYASIIIKGTSKGTVASGQGLYTISVMPGRYTIVCQYVGYKAQERTVDVGSQDVELDFSLPELSLSLQEVVVKKGEDPANAIMRQAIAKRNLYNRQVDSFSVEVYIKGSIRSIALPDKFMGQKVQRKDIEDPGLDSLGRGILFLSESQTKVSFIRPDRIKYEVLSARQSGGGYGIGFPFFINFYVNNVSVFNNNLNPRGFVSPVADNAFHYYRFHFEGSFFEDGLLIDRIRVTPKRTHEPLFDGYIQIVDDQWRIHSVDLAATKDHALELLDTVRIRQIQAPVAPGIWRTQNQVVTVEANTVGFRWGGSFLNVYTNYNLHPDFGKKYFNRVVLSYDTAFNKKDSNYWAQARPVPLELSEQKDFKLRDSLYRRIRDSVLTPRDLDSMQRKQAPVNGKDIFLRGVNRYYFHPKHTLTYRFNGLVPSLSYNTVEGPVLDLVQSLGVRKRGGRNEAEFGLDTRYGFTNRHVNAFGTLTFRPAGNNFHERYLAFSGGKRVEQINRDNPISPLTNSLYTLELKRNYMKIYENWFGSAAWNNRLENGLLIHAGAEYEDRIPLENTTNYAWRKKSRAFTPNHPYELADIPFNREQALVASVALSFQPGQRYVQYPEGRMPLGSKFPTLSLRYTRGIPVWGSDADFDKWQFSIEDAANLKLGGTLRYRIITGGFIHARHVGLPDLQHINGNRTYAASRYLYSFQLAPYYAYSNTAAWWIEGHAEHHFNGLLTNKIPLLNRLKWNLVAGSNALYIDRSKYYVEAFAGIENIVKLFRVDFITAYQAQPGPRFGVRLGLGGLLGGKVDLKK